MHADEGPLRDKGEQWGPVKEKYSGGAEASFTIDDSSQTYNSGVVGLMPGDCALLERVSSLMRDIHHLVPTTHEAEQFAFAHVLGANRSVRTCEDVVQHYWGYERRFIHTGIAESFPDFSKATFNAALAAPERIRRFPAKRKSDLVLAKLKGLQRQQAPAYAFAYLAYRSAFTTCSPKDANAWASIAMDALNWNDFPTQMVATDFRRMNSDRLAGNQWLTETTRARWREYWSRSAHAKF